MQRTVRALVLVVGMSVAAVPLMATSVYAENVVDSLGDTVATIGKKDQEKQAILAERKAKRQAARAEKVARKQAKKASKQLEGAGKGLKKDPGGLTN